MTITTEERTRCYLFVPMVFFGAGMIMTSTLIHIMDLISINSYAVFIFIIDRVLVYALGAMILFKGNIIHCHDSCFSDVCPCLRSFDE